MSSVTQPATIRIRSSRALISRLRTIPLGSTAILNGEPVTRWDTDAYEVAGYGRYTYFTALRAARALQEVAR